MSEDDGGAGNSRWSADGVVAYHVVGEASGKVCLLYDVGLDEVEDSHGNMAKTWLDGKVDLFYTDQTNNVRSEQNRFN